MERLEGKGPATADAIPGLSLEKDVVVTREDVTVTATGGGPKSTVREVTVPLSEHEQRVLEQMEQALYAEDPRFATSLVGKSEARARRRRAALGLVIAIAGLAMVVLAVTMHQIWIGGLGFAAMVFGGVWAMTSPRHKGATLGTVDAEGNVTLHAKSTDASRKQASGKGPKSGLMDRFEERWDKRREEGPF